MHFFFLIDIEKNTILFHFCSVFSNFKTLKNFIRQMHMKI